MVDRYWRKIEDVENDIENAMQISNILLKLKECDEKLGDLGKIEDNENNILSNLEKIEDNENDISSNLGKITTNENAISSNLGKIDGNINAIKLINKNSQDNTKDIASNLEQITGIKSFLPASEIFKKTNSITNLSCKFTRNIIYFKLLEMEIENNFNKYGKLEINSNIYYKYDNLQKDHHCLQHKYQIYDDKNELLRKIILNKTNSTDLDFDNNIMLVKDNFYVTFNNNYNKITVLLYLFRVYRPGPGNFNLELINENFVNITYLDKNDISLKINTNEEDIASNLSKITTNEGNISTNLGKITTNEGKISSNLGKIDTNEGKISANLIKINSNEDDILYNLSEIDYLKNNMSKSYLKNVYNILFYDKKTQIDFRNILYEKIFDVNSSINNFIKMNFKIDVQYEDISERNYVKTTYQLFDENNNSLYMKSVTNNNYTYFSNRVIVDENVFYNFTKSVKKVKFVIKFQMLLSRVIKIWYIKNDNYRLTIKNYGL